MSTTSRTCRSSCRETSSSCSPAFPGSGKSSLAFDTIYAEGQRRYVESLSAYARQFLGQMDKPDVDFIEGLSPAISIDQKTASRNPRSTVGTVTEICDYLRLLYARIGIPHCPNDGTPLVKQTPQQIVDQILELEEGTRFQVLAPIVRGRKGEYEAMLKELASEGFARARIDGEVRDLTEDIKLDRYFQHTIEVVVDRLVSKTGIDQRLTQSLETALNLTDGVVDIDIIDGPTLTFSQHLACPVDGFSFEELQPRNFSFNSPYGACSVCSGIGTSFQVDRRPGGSRPRSVDRRRRRRTMVGQQDALLPAHARRVGRRAWASTSTLRGGTCPPRSARRCCTEPATARSRCRTPTASTASASTRPPTKACCRSSAVVTRTPSPTPPGSTTRSTCGRSRVTPVRAAASTPSRCAVTVSEARASTRSRRCRCGDAHEFVADLKLNERETAIAERVLKEIRARLQFLLDVGLDYLTLARSAATLAGGEAQRIRLATQIGSGLVGVLYILDEPSIGLHQRDNQRLIETLVRLRDLGNTLIVVEHDEDTIRVADHVVDIGPGAGEHGGYIVAQGTMADIAASEASLTGDYLAGRRTDRDSQAPAGSGTAAHRRSRVPPRTTSGRSTCQFPLGSFIAVTGVSGSGKSTLIEDILSKALHQADLSITVQPGAAQQDRRNRTHRQGHQHRPVADRSDAPIQPGHLHRVVRPHPNPVRRRPTRPAHVATSPDGSRSTCRAADATPARVTARSRSRCTSCPTCTSHARSAGASATTVRPSRSSGRATTSATSSRCRWKRRCDFFENQPKIARILQTLYDVGLTYVRLGQPATTLSGGEAQRIKLASELGKRSTGRTFYILDEPTTGLHFEDIRKLLQVLQRLVDAGNTVLVIEHNLDVIKSVDHVIDLGPEGGSGGGAIVAVGTPEEVAEVGESYTGKFLREILT